MEKFLERPKSDETFRKRGGGGDAFLLISFERSPLSPGKGREAERAGKRKSNLKRSNDWKGHGNFERKRVLCNGRRGNEKIDL